jgi:hypothetical protein
MNQKFISLIAACLMLAAPCLNAGLDSWISSILPEKWRAPEETRKHIYAAQKILDIKYPIFVMRTALEEDTLAHTENNASHSIIRINKHRNDDIMHSMYHEMGHVFYDHARKDNAIKTQVSTGFFMTAFALSYGIVRTHHHSLPQKYTILAASAASLASSIYACSKIPTYTPEEKIAIDRERELQAEEIAFQLTQRTHGNAPLKKRLSQLNELALREGNEYQRRGPEYPTAGEEIALIQKTLDKTDILSKN